MKNNLIITTLLLFTAVFLYHQTKTSALEEQLTADKYFGLEYEVGRQSVWNNPIPLTVYITPYSDFNNVEMTFNHGPITEVRYTGPQFFSVDAGDSYRVQARVYPKEPGTHHVTINAIAWEYDTNYTTSASTSIQIDENLQIVPQTQIYKVLNVLKYLFITLLVIAAAVGMYFLALKNMAKIKKWLEPEY